MAILNDKRFAAGFAGLPFIITGAREKRRFGADGKATDVVEAVRITAVSQTVGEIAIDLFPFSREKLERCRTYFGLQFAVDDVIDIENCKIFVFNSSLRVTITAADIQPKIEI